MFLGVTLCAGTGSDRPGWARPSSVSAIPNQKNAVVINPHSDTIPSTKHKLAKKSSICTHISLQLEQNLAQLNATELQLTCLKFC
jgi:hypothetical protein